jgi:hypothetical protein
MFWITIPSLRQRQFQRHQLPDARQNAAAARIPGHHAIDDEFGDPQHGWRRRHPEEAETPREMGVCPKLEMLTPKGEHFIPCSTRVMFDGRISLDGIATAKTL